MTPFARDTSREVGGKIRSIKQSVSRPPLSRDRGTAVVEAEPAPPAHEADVSLAPHEEGTPASPRLFDLHGCGRHLLGCRRVNRYSDGSPWPVAAFDARGRNR